MRVTALWLFLATTTVVPALADTPLPPELRAFRPPWPYDATPVRLMHVPDVHRMLGGWTGTGDSVVAVLSFPSMGPWSIPDPCPKAWCDGKILVTVTTGARPALHDDAWRLRRSVYRAAASETRTETYTETTPPPGYTQAWDQALVVHSDLLPDTSQIFLRSAPDGAPLELANCASQSPSRPSCRVETTLEDAPGIHIEFTFGPQHWNDRDAIRAAVQRTVRSWL